MGYNVTKKNPTNLTEFTKGPPETVKVPHITLYGCGIGYLSPISLPFFRSHLGQTLNCDPVHLSGYKRDGNRLLDSPLESQTME
jgi:hypothetical protein